LRWDCVACSAACICNRFIAVGGACWPGGSCVAVSGSCVLWGPSCPVGCHCARAPPAPPVLHSTAPHRLLVMHALCPARPVPYQHGQNQRAQSTDHRARQQTSIDMPSMRCEVTQRAPGCSLRTTLAGQHEAPFAAARPGEVSAVHACHLHTHLGTCRGAEPPCRLPAHTSHTDL
jgi:hypothetical protein